MSCIQNFIILYILWHTDPLLSDDSVNNDHFWQQLSKHVLAVINTHTTIELLMEMGCFYMVRNDVISKEQRQLLGSDVCKAVTIEPECVALKDLHY